MEKTILETRQVSKKFDTFTVIDKIDFAISEGEIIGLVGPNGAGKTTFLNLITGFYIPDTGSIFFDGKEITKDSPEKRVSAGIIRTFQLVRVFNELTVYDNLALVCYRAYTARPFSFRMFGSTLEDANIREQVSECLKIFELDTLTREPVANLSIGSKRRVEIAMTFLANSKMIVLDEPFAGMSDSEINETVEVFKKSSVGKTILIVEHKISKLLELVKELAVMHEGRIIAFGPPQATIEHPDVRRVYWKIKEEKVSCQ